MASLFPPLKKIAELLSGDVRGDEVHAPGPGHSARDRSMSVRPDKGAFEGFLVHSFAGDNPNEIRDYVRKKLGLPEPARKAKSNGGRKSWTFVSEHIYCTAKDQPYLRVCKMFDESGSKQFLQSHWDGFRWVNGKPKGGKVPYRLPQLIAAPLSATVYFCEGEKDADALAKLELIATTASEGARAPWDSTLTPHFKDRHVVVLPDADEPGRAHGQKVARALDGAAASVKVVDLFPDLSDGSDVANWLETDPTGAQLVRECSQAPLWQPGSHDRAKADEVKLDGGIGTSAAPPAYVKKQADILIQFADETELFHTPGDEAYAYVTVDDHRETYRIRSKTFRSWLSHRFYKTHGGAPNSEAMTSALGTIEARALFDGPEITAYVRVAELEGKLYLDLADDKWRAVEIDGDGWRIVTSPPVRFRRAPGMLPLPEPTADGSIDALRPLLNVRDDNDFVLAVSWLLAAYRPRGPYPILALAGEQGSSKSTLSALLRGLIDPNVAPLRALPREERDLFISASNAHALVFDNVSGLPTWISDALCRLATGGGFATRQLYTDDAEALFAGMRPIILNGIEDVAVRPDLVDRAIMLSLDTIPELKRRPEKELWAAFHRDLPGILGALLDAVAHGLSRLDQVQLQRLPRMADFYKWGVACETAFWPEGTFAAAYSVNRDGAITVTIEADLVATAAYAFMSNHQTWIGTASELLAALGDFVTEVQRRSKEWPNLPHFLSGRLRRAAPVLRKAGIEINFARDGKRTIHINRLPESEPQSASAASTASDDSRAGGLATDARADAGDYASVSRNSLNTPAPDVPGAPDAAGPSASAEDRCCCQCKGALDGTEQSYDIDDQRVLAAPSVPAILCCEPANRTQSDDRPLADKSLTPKNVRFRV